MMKKRLGGSSLKNIKLGLDWRERRGYRGRKGEMDQRKTE